jgi:RNA polymerase sigma-70 factor (ECF subfamily)
MPIAITTDFGATRDEVLIRRITAGETHLFPKLVEPYVRAASAAVHAVLEQRADAEDAMQQAILQAFCKLSQLRSHRLFRPWLLQIATNEARLIRRQGRRFPLDYLEDEETIVALPAPLIDHHALPSENCELAELRAVLNEAIRDLPAKYREVVFLRQIEEVSTKDAAVILGITPNGVKARLHRARRRLRERLIRDKSQVARRMRSKPLENHGSMPHDARTLGIRW